MDGMFDLLVIGGGPAGYLASERAGDAGLSVCCFEKQELGGVCLNEGCIPSKALLNSAKIYEQACHGEPFGVIAGELALDQGKVQKRRAKVVRTLVAGVKAKLRGSGVQVVKAEAMITGKEGDAFTVQAGGETYRGKNLLIAAGSVPVLPPIPGLLEALEGGTALTNREVLTLQAVPAHLIVIGGGVVGLEMAAYYRTAGSQVTVIEMMDKIAGPTDGEISALLLAAYAKKGVDFRLGAKVEAFDGGTVTYEKDGQTHAVTGDKVLVSIGRRAAFEGLGLETIGVETARRGILTDGAGRTNVPGVYAAGDVNGLSMLAHTAYREAEVCVNTILGRQDEMAYNAIPSVIYTSPEVASVGETEESAAASAIPYESQKLSLRYAGRFVAENEGDGLCKVVIHKESRALLGVHIIGPYASEIIWGAAEMIRTGTTVMDAKKLVFPHPTVSEIIREVLWTF